ncbi:MAG TPA: hypothetical protein VNH65_21205 [Candidatus Acidoferrum sp.]|nr:hypothetical protein [Candidatus Acidoferrum sp.]
MEGFQAGNIDAIRSERVVCVVKSGDLRVKSFQVVFGGDGSLFITFPYFQHRMGILSASAIAATGTRESQVNLEQRGKVTSHLVKYSHHTDGSAHFSQAGKIITAIKRQSIALDKQHGHIFSLLIQGLEALEVADPARDSLTSSKRALVEFAMESPEAIKFAGHWFDVNKLRFNNPTPTIGPTILMVDPDGIQRNACMFASPNANARHVLAITCEAIARLGPEPEMFLLYGGFDPAETMKDVTKEAGFLAFLYSISEAEKLRERLGTVDFIPKS